MKQILAPEIFSLLTQWASRPDASTDLRNIFGGDSDRYQPLLQSIRSGDFSWVPQVQILPAAFMESADGAYARETSTIYLSANCPADLKESVLLEEVGHHIDALFNEQETPGDEGTLFSATVRGITLSDEEITAILNEDDSAVLSLNGRQVAVECAKTVTAPVIIGPGIKSGSDTLYTPSTTTMPAGIHGLVGTGSANITLTGNSPATPLVYNYLQANSGNTTLVAGNAATTSMVGGSGNDWFLGGAGTQTDYFKGGSGNSTMVAANGLATLIGGTGNNSLVAGISPTRTVGQSLIGGGGANTLRGGTGKDTLRSGAGYNTLISGSRSTAQSNTLLGGGISNSLVAGLGNDSLAALSGSSTLKGGTGKVSLLSGTGTNSLFSGSTVGLPGNGNLLNATLGTSNTLVAGLGRDTLIGGSKQNLLLVNQANLAAFAKDNITLSNLASASNTLGLSSTSPVTVNDSLFATMATAKVSNLGTVADLPIQGGASNKIILGTNAEKVGVHTLVAGLGSDTLSVAGYATNSALLDASKSLSRTSLVGGGTGNDTFLGSKGGYDTMIGAAGNDLFIAQNTTFGSIVGGAGSNTLQLKYAAALGAQSFYNIRQVQTLELGIGVNSAGSLQGSGITKIITNSTNSTTPGNDTLSANVVGSVKNVTGSGSGTASKPLVLTIPNGVTGAMGFETGQVISGNGIVRGTTITNVDTLTAGLIKLTLSTPTTGQIAQGSFINGWIDNATLDGSLSRGINYHGSFTNPQRLPVGTTPNNDFAVNASTNNFLTAANNVIYSANAGSPSELREDTIAVSALQNNPVTYIRFLGDYLTAGGTHDLLIGAQSQLPDTILGGESKWVFTDSEGNEVKFGSDGVPALKVHQVIDNTLVSGAYATNTLNGGSGTNLYLLNNFVGDTIPGNTNADGTIVLPYIVNNATTTLNSSITGGGAMPLQSGSTIQFTGNGVRLSDASFKNVSAAAAQKILTADGNNLISIGTNAAPIGIQTIIGGVGSDTFVTGLQLGDPVSVTLSSVLDNTSIIVSDTTALSVGSLVTGAGIADKTTILGIDTDSGIVLLSKEIDQTQLTPDELLIATPLLAYVPSVYFDASRGSGNQSLASGSGNDTLLAGSGNATLIGGDGNNTLRGGLGNNLILSGVGNSTLDGGYGVSTLQADGGLNHFIVRNRNTRILNPYTLEEDPLTGVLSSPNPAPIATTTEIGIVDTYVNFDPIQSTQVNQFAPTLPDGSPSITKSISFASSDLSSFYNLQYFNLLGSAMYGVGNAWDNTRSSASANALILGMGGNNTLIGNGDNTSLYGYVNSAYANPDLYAAAPYDTRDQMFIDGVIGLSGNNYIVANGANSYLDGGPGYNDRLGDSSGSNTLIGTKGGDTFIVRNQADVVVAASGNNHLVSTVDLHSIADNINDITLLVTKQAPDLPNIDPNNPALPANSGQTDPATFLSVGNSVPNSTASHGYALSQLTVIVPNSTQLDVQYGTAEGEQYSSTSSDPDHQITVAPVLGIPTSKILTWTAYTPPASTGLGAVVGYSVYYRSDDGSGNLGPWKTYVNGTSQDMSGTATSPSLTVDNLPTLPVGQTYDFRVTAQQLTLPSNFTPAATSIGTGDLGTNQITLQSVAGFSVGQTVTGVGIQPGATITIINVGINTITLSANITANIQNATIVAGQWTPTPVTLQGSNKDDVIWAFMPAESLFGGALVGYDSNAPILTNNPNGNIPVPTQPDSSTSWDSYPVYMDGQNGNDLFVTQQIGNGDGSSYTVGGLTYSGLDTMVGGIGSDTFIISNGDTSFNNGVVTNGPNGFDLCIKYGNETSVDYTKVAPSTPVGIGATGVSLNGGQHNLIISNLAAIKLSDTVVSQGKFIDQLLVNGSKSFGEGNRLDNFIYDVNATKGANTLVGYTGRDSIVGTGADVLIGGTATGLDSIVDALADYAASGPTSVSIYRDTDPTPTTAITGGGPGFADPSQFWTQNGRLGGLVYNYLGNSDTLIATAGGTLDGGAGNDSMVAAGTATFYVSAGGDDVYYNKAGILTNAVGKAADGTQHLGYGDNYKPTNTGQPTADVVSQTGDTGQAVGTIVYTGSDVYWSGLTGATTAQLGYALSNSGDSAGGQSISNITLQMGDAIARFATGNSTSTGNANLAGGSGEVGSNILIGNQYGATLNGGGVGGTDSLGAYGNGQGIGIDILVGNAGNSTGGYAVSTTNPSVTGKADTFVIGANYTGSISDQKAAWALLNDVFNNLNLRAGLINNQYATDQDYAVINAKGSSVDSLSGGSAQLGTNTGATINLALGTYVIGSAPNHFQTGGLGDYNLNGLTGTGAISSLASAAANSSNFGIYAIDTNAAGDKLMANLVAVVEGIKLDSNPLGSDLSLYTFNGLTADGQNGLGHMGGDDFSAVFNNGTVVQNNAAKSFLGMGAFYNLAGSNFAAQHVHLG